jgi:hypothetical protein
MITLREYLAVLNKIVAENPEAINYSLIYSHDDEGNEIQRVINLPSVCYVEPSDNYRFLEVDYESEIVNSIIIN